MKIRHAPAPHIRDEAHLREFGILNVVNVESCIAMIRGFTSAVPLTRYYSFTHPLGMPASWIHPHLELFADKGPGLPIEHLST